MRHLSRWYPIAIVLVLLGVFLWCTWKPSYDGRRSRASSSVEHPAAGGVSGKTSIRRLHSEAEVELAAQEEEGPRKVVDADKANEGEQDEGKVVEKSAEGEGGEEGEEGEEGAEGEEGEEEEGEEEEIEFDTADFKMSVMLLGSMTFVMALFYLVNHPDKDMKRYSWQVISCTISIFVAVMFFTSLNMLIMEILLEEYSEVVRTVGSLVQMLTYWTVMQFATAWLSSAVPCAICDTGPLKQNPNDVEDADARAKLIEQQMYYILVRVRCWTMLLAHVTGFAAITFGGHFQQSDVVKAHPILAYAVAFLGWIPLALLGRLCRLLRESYQGKDRRHSQLTNLDEVGGASLEEFGKDRAALIEFAKELWSEECFETENDIVGLYASFLLVNACRYSISGVLPNAMGIEYKQYIHSVSCSWSLVGCALLFGTITVVMVKVMESESAKNARIAKHTPGHEPNMVVRRVMKIVTNTAGMACAWSLMYAAKWELSRYGVLGLPFNITARLVLALVLSFFAFLIITVLDQLADSDQTGATADAQIKAVINALALLVGFTWEQTFDVAVEAIADKSKNPSVASIVLATLVGIIVIPAWRAYILPTVIRLEKEAAAEDSARQGGQE